MNKFQEVMDLAYKRYESGMSQQAFWDQLDAKERIAVFIGNMNYQVENGGWSQWMGNRYASEETVGFIERKLEEVNTPEALTVIQMLKTVRDFAEMFGWDLSGDIDDHDFEELSSNDSEYYNVNNELMRQVEQKFFA